MRGFWRTAQILEESLKKYPNCARAVIETWCSTLDDSMFNTTDVKSMFEEIDVSEEHRLLLDEFIFGDLSFQVEE